MGATRDRWAGRPCGPRAPSCSAGTAHWSQLEPLRTWALPRLRGLCVNESQLSPARLRFLELPGQVLRAVLGTGRGSR